MIRETLLNLGTAEIADGSQETFRIPSYAFRNGQFPTVYAEGLGASETVSFWLPDGSGFQEMYDGQSSPAQVIIDPTNSKSSATFNTPGTFGVTKTATSAAIKLILLY